MGTKALVFILRILCTTWHNLISPHPSLPVSLYQHVYLSNTVPPSKLKLLLGQHVIHSLLILYAIAILRTVCIKLGSAIDVGIFTA